MSSHNVVLSLSLALMSSALLLSWKQEGTGAGVHTSVYYPDKHKSRQNNTKYLKISILWRNICCSNNNLHKLVNTGVRHSVSVASANKQRKSQKQNNSRSNNNKTRTTMKPQQFQNSFWHCPAPGHGHGQRERESVLRETANSGLKIN